MPGPTTWWHSGWSPERRSTNSLGRGTAGSSAGSTPRRSGGDRPSPAPRRTRRRRPPARPASRWPGVTAWLAADGQPAAEGPTRARSPPRCQAGLGDAAGHPARMPDQMYEDRPLKEQGFRVRGGSARPSDPLAGSRSCPHIGSSPNCSCSRPRGRRDCPRDVSRRRAADHGGRDSTVRIWRVRDRDLVLLRVLPYHDDRRDRPGAEPRRPLRRERRRRGTDAGLGPGRIAAKPRDGPRPMPADTRLAFLPDRSAAVRVARPAGPGMLWDTTGTVPRVNRSCRSGRHLASAPGEGRRRRPGRAFGDDPPDRGRRQAEGTGPRGDGRPADGLGTGTGWPATRRRRRGRPRPGLGRRDPGTLAFRHDYGEGSGTLRLDPSGGAGRWARGIGCTWRPRARTAPAWPSRGRRGGGFGPLSRPTASGWPP